MISLTGRAVTLRSEDGGEIEFHFRATKDKTFNVMVLQDNASFIVNNVSTEDFISLCDTMTEMIREQAEYFNI